MSTRAKASSGAASPKLNPAKIRKISQPTAPKPATDSAYEACRIAEIQARSELYKLKLKRAQDELLDAKMLRIELAQMYEAIRAIISASKLTDREKSDCLRNLRPVDEILALVASQQNVELRQSDGNGKSHHGEDELP